MAPTLYPRSRAALHAQSAEVCAPRLGEPVCGACWTFLSSSSSCPAFPQGLSPVGASKDWQEGPPCFCHWEDVEFAASKSCDLGCLLWEDGAGLGDVEGEGLASGSASGFYGVLQEPKGLVLKADGKRTGFASVLCRNCSDESSNFVFSFRIWLLLGHLLVY